jgi:hypothetical protein
MTGSKMGAGQSVRHDRAMFGREFVMPTEKRADTVGAPSSSWVESSTQVRIVIGEFCLAKIRFRVMTLPHLDWRYPVDITNEAIHGLLQSNVKAIYLPSFCAPERLPRLCFRKKSVRYVPWQGGRYYVDLDGTFQEYLRRFKAKSRKNLTRSVRIIAEASCGTIDFREYRHVGDMSAFYAEASQITKKTYQHRLLKSGLPQTEDFCRRLVELAGLGRVRGYILFFRKSPVAFAYCTVQDDVLTYQIIGYDPAFQQYSPGTVLLHCILDRIFSERRFRVFDFGTGEASYKSFFSTDAAPSAVVYELAYTPKNLVFLGVHLAASLTSSATAKILSAFGTKDYVKKFFRRVGR